MNGIARGVSPCVQDPPSLAAEEQTLWERSTYEGGVSKVLPRIAGVVVNLGQILYNLLVHQ